jgi:hypothetical protein
MTDGKQKDDCSLRTNNGHSKSIQPNDSYPADSRRRPEANPWAPEPMSGFADSENSDRQNQKAKVD